MVLPYSYILTFHKMNFASPTREVPSDSSTSVVSDLSDDELLEMAARFAP